MKMTGCARTACAETLTETTPGHHTRVQCGDDRGLDAVGIVHKNHIHTHTNAHKYMHTHRCTSEATTQPMHKQTSAEHKRANKHCLPCWRPGIWFQFAQTRFWTCSVCSWTPMRVGARRPPANTAHELVSSQIEVWRNGSHTHTHYPNHSTTHHTCVHTVTNVPR